MEKSTLPPKESGPTKFLLDDYDMLEGIEHCLKTLQEKQEITIQTQHIYSHLDKQEKQKKIYSTKGEKILNQHITNTIARNLNNICDKEAALHHEEENCPNLPTAPNQLKISFDSIPITTKKMDFVQKLHHKKLTQHT